MHRYLVAVLICAFAAPLAAQEQDVLRYDVRLLGIKIGVMTIAAQTDDKDYAARSIFSTAGLVRVFQQIEADVRVQGAVRKGKLMPSAYHEEIDDGDRVTNVDVRFSPGPPRLVAGDAGSSAPPADVSQLIAAIDPLTGLYALLRDQPKEGACDFSADIFDGHRLARIVATQAEYQDDRLICSGTYQRVAGYTSSERRDRKVPLTIHYAPYGDLLRAHRIEIQSRYGRAVVNRL